MNTVKDEDDFWYSSERRSFCFENEVMVVTNCKLCANSLSGKYLRIKLQVDQLKKRKYHEIDDTQPDITLRHILLGQSYSLERYKSLARKTALLDAAISNGDGNSILIIILFLIKTLKRSLVQRLLMERPDAINVYIYYLFIRLQTSEITDILTQMKNLHIVIKNTKDPNRLQQKLHNCYKALFTMLPNCKETIFLESYIKLLEWQMAIKQKKNDEELLLNSSILESLHYACKHHCNTPNDFVTISPMMLSRNHNISPRLYEKVTLQVKAACGGWDDIDRLLLTKGILGNTKLQTHLYTEDVLKILYKYNAPHTVLEKYLKFIDNLEKRLELAKKLSCHTIVIDIFVQQGDRAVLMDYKAKLQPQSEDYFYAESALHLPNIKWKN
ncbi:VPS33B-interacting protein [Cyphomyrmex costatus]|uniref:VPS33B-interacting protein n=1 Tax=Cyphomyrmex costatus TaxID=456900 RepID=A0A151IJ32_9HYME|nr:VPS33B-interacting protein [Cyphomyrmex costatus]